MAQRANATYCEPRKWDRPVDTHADTRVRSRKREKGRKEELASAVHTGFDKLFHCRLFLVGRCPALLVEDNEGILESLHTEAVGVVSRASALFSEGGEGGREGGREGGE